MQLRHQVICFQSEINVGTILGIVIIIIIIGFLVRVETVVKAVKYSQQ
jgi:hypothetical protein